MNCKTSPDYTIITIIMTYKVPFIHVKHSSEKKNKKERQWQIIKQVHMEKLVHTEKKKEAFKIKDAWHYQNKRPTIKQMLKTLNCII